MLDGARNALLGYLYQLLGTAAVSVREVEFSEDTWVHMIARVGKGVLTGEEFGQDAVVHPAVKLDGMTAIQFKHSVSAGNLIDRNELIDILFAFDRSRREAEVNGFKIEHYALVTNRQLDAQAQLIFDNRSNSVRHHSLMVAASRKGTPAATNVKRLIPYHGDRAKAADAWHAIIRSLEVFPGETFEADLKRLRRFAARYGVLEAEWTDRLNALVGALVCETAKGAIGVTREWLKSHLIGDREAANLQFGTSFPPHISIICRDRLNHRAKQQHPIRPDLYLERQIQQDLAAQLEQHPVVFVAGDGGRGKSLAVVSYLLSIADRQVVWSEGAAAAAEEELVGALTVARLPGRQHGRTDRRLCDLRARLDVANGGPRPLWTIDLDGIDEAPDRYSQIRELINLCWARGRHDASPASLIVTCRSPTSSRVRESLIGHWLDSPEPKLVEGVGVLLVGNFVDQELTDAARLLNGLPEKRIIGSLSVSETVVTSFAAPVPQEILQTLRHPVVWGGYASLPESDRSGILDQQSIPLARLAAQLHSRFVRRCWVRKEWRDVRMLERALPAVARSMTSAPPYLPESWDQACELYLDRSEAKHLYSESLSYGIIERDDGRKWRWGHPFLARYLATVEEGEASE